MTQTALTREKVLKATGTVLDVMVAVHIFKEPVGPLYLPMIMRDKRYYFIPDYSTDISAAWEVVEKMSRGKVDRSFALEFHFERYYAAFGEVPFRTDVMFEFAPEAICKAALLAVLDL